MPRCFRHGGRGNRCPRPRPPRLPGPQPSPQQSSHLLHHLSGGVQVDEALVNAHLKAVKGVGTLQGRKGMGRQEGDGQVSRPAQAGQYGRHVWTWGSQSSGPCACRLRPSLPPARTHAKQAKLHMPLHHPLQGQRSTAQHSAAQRSMLPNSIAQHSTAQHGAPCPLTLPQGDLRVVIFRQRVGMRTGPFTLSCLSLAPRIRSAHTAGRQRQGKLRRCSHSVQVLLHKLSTSS